MYHLTKAFITQQTKHKRWIRLLVHNWRSHAQMVRNRSPPRRSVNKANPNLAVRYRHQAQLLNAQDIALRFAFSYHNLFTLMMLNRRPPSQRVILQKRSSRGRQQASMPSTPVRRMITSHIDAAEREVRPANVSILQKHSSRNEAQTLDSPPHVELLTFHHMNSFPQKTSTAAERTRHCSQIRLLISQSLYIDDAEQEAAQPMRHLTKEIITRPTTSINAKHTRSADDNISH